MNNELRILIVGDFCPINRTEELILQENRNTLFNDLIPIIEGSHIAIVNLECPLTKSVLHINKTGPKLKASPQTARVLSQAGFSIATIANNHIMDFGSEGLRQTINACRENDILCVGAGDNLDQAKKFVVVERNSYKVAILNFTENEFSTTHGNYPGANPLNVIENFREIRRARDIVDFVIVIVHCGNEMYDLPSPRIKETFRFFAEAGASAVLGHHPHVPGGFEIHNGVPLFYSLGNFVFDYPGVTDNRWHLGYAVELCLGNGTDFKIIPFAQSLRSPGIQLLTDDEKRDFDCHIQKLGSILLDDSLLKEEFNKFCFKNKKLYLSYLEPHSISILNYLKNHKLFPSILTKRKKTLYLNLFRCEAHREVIENLLLGEIS